jgi:ubiquinone/menaquinone biosynthesis C-methylase UbiE
VPAENPFVGSDVARRYAQARPDFHAEVVALITERLPSVRRGLDVGCGTGLSTRPLAKIADVCVGVDVSAEMLSEALARTSPHVYFVAGTAERLPFTDGAFELVTVSSAAHWFDQEAFLTEARRVMRSSGVARRLRRSFRGADGGG